MYRKLYVNFAPIDIFTCTVVSQTVVNLHDKFCKEFPGINLQNKNKLIIHTFNKSARLWNIRFCTLLEYIDSLVQIISLCEILIKFKFSHHISSMGRCFIYDILQIYNIHVKEKSLGYRHFTFPGNLSNSTPHT